MQLLRVLVVATLAHTAQAYPELAEDEGRLPCSAGQALRGARRRQLGGKKTSTSCGEEFCYGRFLPDTEEPFFLPFDTLLDIGRPAPTADLFNYMEDSQARSNELSGFPLNNVPPRGAAGHTYVGQLLSHDVNLDLTSVLGVSVDPTTLPNSNTPYIDLDTLYTFGRRRPPPPRKFSLCGTVEDPNLIRDFCRRRDGTARILDLRNDEHRIVSQLTVGLMALHNKFFDDFMATSTITRRSKRRKAAFAFAKDETIKAWQSVVLTDMLPTLVDETVIDEVKDPANRVLYTGALREDALMPTEFSTAAYRLFHSRARGRYRLNNETDGSDSTRPRARLFDVGNDEPILTGGTPMENLFVIEWDRFFGETAERARILDMLYSRPMMRLTIGAPGMPEEPVTVECDEPECPLVDTEIEVCNFETGVCSVTASLAQLDLTRGQTHSLPGGRQLAAYVRDVLNVTDVDVLSMEYMESGNVFGLPVNYTTEVSSEDVPLLLYLAHESLLEQDGQVLGKLGSRIIAEVLYGLVEDAEPSIFDENGTMVVSPITGTPEVSMLDILSYVGF